MPNVPPRVLAAQAHPASAGAALLVLMAFILGLLPPLISFAASPVPPGNPVVRPRPPQSDSLPPVPPRMEILGGSETPVRLASVRISTEILGSEAETTVDMGFYNPNNRVLEGKLHFPLLDGQTISSFAMDVQGKLREAVPVEKAKGRAVFEEISRRNVDPGLLEVTEGNNFQLRVYPLAPRQEKRVVIRYRENLEAGKTGLIYRLPLTFGDSTQPLDRLQLSLRVHGPKPQAYPQNLVGPLEFQGSTVQVYEASADLRQYARHGVLTLQLPDAGSVATAYGEEVRDGKRYFTDEITLPRTATSAKSPPLNRPLPRVVGLIWDASASAQGRDRTRELDVLDTYFQHLGMGEVRLFVLRDTLEAPRSFNIRGGDWRALRTVLETLPLDGATAFPELASVLARNPATGGIGEFLLISDGLANYGSQTAPLPVAAVPVYALQSSLRADPDRLRALAQASGGRYIDLTRDEPREASRQLLEDSPRVIRVEGTGVSDLLLDSPYPRLGRIRVAGVLNEARGEIRIQVREPGGHIETLRQGLVANAAPSRSAAGTWARYKLAQLLAEPEANQGAITRLGQEFRLPTRETSLIILDRVEDYVRYHIAPPPELAAEYRRLSENQRQTRERERSQHLDNMVRLWAARSAWWDQSFPKDAPPELAKEGTAVTDSATGNLREPAPSNMPAPAAAPPMRARAPASQVHPSLTAMAKTAANQEGGGPATPTEATIRLQAWRPDTPYLQRLQQVPNANLYATYLDLRPDWAQSTAFYLDVADLFVERGEPALARRILSNLAEMDLDNRQVLRILAHRLVQAGAPELAIPIFRRVRDMAPDEPQSWRDLGLALAAREPSQEAADALWEVVSQAWSPRFPEIQMIALEELNALLAQAAARGTPLRSDRYAAPLLRNLPVDLRVILTWDSDDTDMDLWVTDPNGEKAFYGHRQTRQGGTMSPDFTGGYGPEEFLLKDAKPGLYKVEVNYYGNRQQIIAGATTLQVRLQTGFGRPDQQEQAVTLRLKDRSEVVRVGEFQVK